MPERGAEAAEVELGHHAQPEAAAEGAVPGVVVVHDVWGLSAHTRDVAQRLAREGFGVLAVDLYRREPAPPAIDDVGRWMRALSDPQILADIEAAAAFLAEAPASRGRRVGVVGFCMGGSYALLAACGGRGIAASVPFYGLLSHEHGLLHDPAGLDPARKPRSPLEAARGLSCPLLAFFGADDPYVPVADVRELERRLAGGPHPAEVVVVEGAGHAFMNDTRPDAYRPEAARAAWTRTVAFLHRHLD